jgi:hypothetical protein
VPEVCLLSVTRSSHPESLQASGSFRAEHPRIFIDERACSCWAIPTRAAGGATQHSGFHRGGGACVARKDQIGVNISPTNMDAERACSGRFCSMTCSSRRGPGTGTLQHRTAQAGSSHVRPPRGGTTSTA